MLDSLNLPDEAAVKAVEAVDKHAGETYDLLLNPIAMEIGSGLADLIRIFFCVPHFLTSQLFKDKAKQFINELLEKKRHIPDGRLIEPDFQTVSVALEDCRHCITSDDLRHMFVNLICNSMDSAYSSSIHPSFPELIKR